jgi:putative tricarboxylic transport membrane protein
MHWKIVLAIFGGMLLGLVIGVIPGMTAALGLAVILPLTFQMDPLTALVLMTSVYTGSLTGGGILAILINTPGTPGAVATTFDGYPMTKKGLHNEALGLQITASVIGGILSYIALLFFIRPMTTLALEFGPSEMLFLTIFVLVLIAALQNEHPERSIFAGLLGLMMSTIGTSTASGLERGTYGFNELLDGLPLILCIIGMFALPEMISIITRQSIANSDVQKSHDLKRLFKGAKQALGFRRTLMRGSIIGILVGLLPAAGATLASLLSYTFAKNTAKPDQIFGEGEPEGVVAAESANNASEGGAMAILMALGIPGSAATAVILGGFMLHGLVPGGNLFLSSGPLVYGLILSNILQMIFLGGFALLVAYNVARIVVVPSSVLVPVLIVIVSLGAFSLRNFMFDVFLLYIFGMIGWFFRRYHFALVSFMIGLFLGRQLDEEIIRFNVLFMDTPADILDRPIAVTFIVLTLLVIGMRIRTMLQTRKGAGKHAT